MIGCLGAGVVEPEVSEGAELGAEPAELGEVERSETAQPPPSLVGERDPDDSLVGAIDATRHEPVGLGPVDEPDGAVVAQQQFVCQLTHGRLGLTASSTDGQQELVLGGGEAGLRRSLVRPAEVAAQVLTERGELSIVGVAEGLGWRVHILARY